MHSHFLTRLQLLNKGSVSVDYNWQVILETIGNSPGPRSVTFATDRPATAAALAVRDVRPSSASSSLISDAPYMPFTVNPAMGSIRPGKKTDFVVKFSPLDVNEYEGRLICRLVLCL